MTHKSFILLVIAELLNMFLDRCKSSSDGFGFKHQIMPNDWKLVKTKNQNTLRTSNGCYQTKHMIIFCNAGNFLQHVSLAMNCKPFLPFFGGVSASITCNEKRAPGCLEDLLGDGILPSSVGIISQTTIWIPFLFNNHEISPKLVFLLRDD